MVVGYSDCGAASNTGLCSEQQSPNQCTFKISHLKSIMRLLTSHTHNICFTNHSRYPWNESLAGVWCDVLSYISTGLDHSHRIINKSTQTGKQQPFTLKHTEVLAQSPTVNFHCWRGEVRWCWPLCLWMTGWTRTKISTTTTAHPPLLYLGWNIDSVLLMPCAKYKWTPDTCRLRSHIGNKISL